MKRYQVGKHIQHFLETYTKEPGSLGRKNEQAFELLALLDSLGLFKEWEPDCDHDWRYVDQSYRLLDKIVCKKCSLERK